VSATVPGAQREARLLPRVLEAPYLLVAAAVVVGVAIGLVSARSALAAIALPLAGFFVAAAFRNLAIGVVLFTVLAFFQLIPGFEGSGVTLVKAAGLVLAAAWAVALADRRNAIPFLPRDNLLIGIGAAAFWLWGASSALWAIDTGAVTTYLSRVGQGVLLFLIVYSALREPKHLRWFVWTFSFGAFMAGALGLIHGTGAGGDRLVSVAIGDPNYLAAALIPGLVLQAFLLMTTRSPLARTLLVAMATVTAISLFMTQSRGGVIGLGAALLAGVLLSGPARVRVIVVALLISAAGVAYYGYFASQEARDRVTSLSPEASSGRADLWTVAVREFDAHPLTGVGGGNFVTAKPAYATETVNITRLDRVVDDPVVTHNTYLEILAELGLVGIALFAVIALGSIAIGLRGAQRLGRAGFKETALLGRGVVIATIGMLAAFTFLSAQYEKNLWLLLGASAALASLATQVQTRRSTDSEASNRTRAFGRYSGRFALIPR
jgi:O-antigen ligase